MRYEKIKINSESMLFGHLKLVLVTLEKLKLKRICMVIHSLRAIKEKCTYYQKVADSFIMVDYFLFPTVANAIFRKRKYWVYPRCI